MRIYGTLYDRNYAAKGLAMHQSLLEQSSEPFLLYILPMDAETHSMLAALNLPQVQLIEQAAFEQTMGLDFVKAGRSRLEYFWTCASQLADFILSREASVTYLDADLFFLSDPKVIFEEIGEKSIGIVPHRLIPSKKHLDINGIFNVGWVSFRKTVVGRTCSMHWAMQCREWCFNRVEATRFGDQKYLDAWPAEYGPECCVIQNIGANLAPWNLRNYRVSMRDGEIYVDDTKAVFFHAHEFRDESHLTNYGLRLMDLLIYDRYIAGWRAGRVKAGQAL